MTAAILPEWLEEWRRAGRLEEACGAAIAGMFAFAERAGYGPEVDMERVLRAAAEAMERAPEEEAVLAGARAVGIVLDGFVPVVLGPEEKG